MKKIGLATACAAVLVGQAYLAACSDSLVTGGLPLTVEMSASAAGAEVGDTIEFVVEATGENLVGIALDFGDGTADSTAAAGAVTAGVRRDHTYAEAATYTVIATVTDIQSIGLVDVADTVTVIITDGGG